MQILPVMIVDDPRFSEHLTVEGHYECPDRYAAVHNALVCAGLLTNETHLAPRAATADDLLRCHGESYIKKIEDEIENLSDGQLALLSTGDVVISPKSFETALLAAGAVLTGVDAVMRNLSQRVFCNIRPPGHHACPHQGMGFCLLNNAAIGARYAQAAYGVKKVLIVDWDVHHGNGTQEIFYEDPNVYYFSTHQSGIYPGTGKRSETGAGNGEGTTLNIPINEGIRSRLDVIGAVEGALTNAMNRFRPELVIISAGFDAHERDPLGSMNLKSEDFATLTRAVCLIADKFAKGRIVSVLEGGYDMTALAESAVAHVQSLRG